MKEERLNEVILNTEDDLKWYRVSFVYMVYPGETFDDAHLKVASSLSHFPYQIHSFNMVRKQPTGGWGHLVEQVVDIGLYPDVTIEDTFRKFDNVVHLQQYELAEDQPVKKEKELVDV